MTDRSAPGAMQASQPTTLTFYPLLDFWPPASPSAMSTQEPASPLEVVLHPEMCTPLSARPRKVARYLEMRLQLSATAFANASTSSGGSWEGQSLEGLAPKHEVAGERVAEASASGNSSCEGQSLKGLTRKHEVAGKLLVSL
eukprot:CAMPEP_0171069064 /NCGR_PEP_ID=MMETSP0766_2-20121228/8927_1 /TAXON_ID=439317 /ORGANISM="Gambierdiscus australes, Strain CAWD 149" /LENGTH=141 /DNA_ID=CAMNT_0011525419 /DNA_START=12 /DNA_END=437 /DNA_ORIENTATION=+